MSANTRVDIRIRKANVADAAGIARVQIDTWRSSYAGIVPTEHLSGLSYENCESRWNDVLTTNRADVIVLVAETAEAEVVGFASGGPEREKNSVYLGELYSIYILREYQRRKLGRRLVVAASRFLLSVGLCSMLLWVLKDNHPSRRFYESLGGEEVRKKEILIGGASISEVAYGWKTIANLAD